MMQKPPPLYRPPPPVGVPSSINGTNSGPRLLAPTPSAAAHNVGATSIHQLRLEAYVNGTSSGSPRMSNGPPNMTTTNRLPVPHLSARSADAPVLAPAAAPVVLGQVVEISSSVQRKEQAPAKAPKRKRIKDCFIDLTETNELTAAVNNSADKPESRIQQFRFQEKTISCLERNGRNMALLEALCRVYFPQCTIEAFSEALGTALHAPITELTPAEEALFIIYYHLPTDALKCRRVVDIRHFAAFFPQLTYMLKDRATDAGDVEVIFTEKVCLPDGVVAANGAPQPTAVVVPDPAPAGVSEQSRVPVPTGIVRSKTPEPGPSSDTCTRGGDDGNAGQAGVSTETQQTSQIDQQETLLYRNGTHTVDGDAENGREACKRMRLNGVLDTTSLLAATPASLIDILDRASPHTTTPPRGSPLKSIVPMPNGVVSVELPDCKNGIVAMETNVSSGVAGNGDKLVICID